MMWGVVLCCMVGLFGKDGMLSRDCRPGVCIFAGHSSVRNQTFDPSVLIEAREQRQIASQKGHKWKPLQYSERLGRCRHRSALPDCGKQHRCRSGCSSHRFAWGFQQEAHPSSSSDWWEKVSH